MSSETALRDALDALCERFGVAELYVFGSRASEIAGRVHGRLDVAPQPAAAASDVDLAVRPRSGRRLDVDAVVNMALAMEQVLGVGRVDLVVLPGASPFLALDIVRGELLYCADADDQAEFELYVLRRAGDLAAFQRARHELVLSRGADA